MITWDHYTTVINIKGNLNNVNQLGEFLAHNKCLIKSRFYCYHGEGNSNTPVFLPGESQGQQSLVACRLWGRTASDTTEVTRQHYYHRLIKCYSSN